MLVKEKYIRKVSTLTTVDYLKQVYWQSSVQVSTRHSGQE